MRALRHLIRSADPIEAIGAHLDRLAPAAREAAVNGLGRRDQRRLFDKAADAPPLDLTHFVPAGVPDLTPVHHPGRNTVATLRYFQRFEKRFARPANDAARLFGYNASAAWFITPGYFVAYETEGAWRERGGVVIDYHLVPDAEVPGPWPAIRENAEGLQRLVYHRTRDFMRRVSAHASIGRASRETDEDVLIDYWFTLCRPPIGDEPRRGTP